MGNKETSLTFRLFARPSFISGMAQVFDFGGSMLYYHRNQTGAEADYHALSADWKMIGKDIGTAIDKHGEPTRQER